MMHTGLPQGYIATGWKIDGCNGWDWILLKLYVLCLEHKIDPSMITTEKQNGQLKISINGLVSTEFAIEVRSLEKQALNVCSICGNIGYYYIDINNVLCKYHYIIKKIHKLRNKFLLNININKHV